MVEYRERADAVTANLGQPAPVPALSGDSNTPAFMTLAAQYGLDEDDMGLGNNNSNQQTIEQEYQAYITSTLSNGAVDIIKFWEVSMMKLILSIKC